MVAHGSSPALGVGDPRPAFYRAAYFILAAGIPAKEEFDEHAESGRAAASTMPLFQC